MVVQNIGKQTSSECSGVRMQGFKLMYCFLSASGVCMQMVVQNIEQTNFLRVLLGCGCRVSS